MAVNWTSKQQEVIDSRNRNLLVSAAAGSGKTAVLVERIIRMISEGDRPLDIDQLLVMTFTNAAAAEMRERIGAAVEQKLKERPEDEYSPVYFLIALMKVSPYLLSLNSPIPLIRLMAFLLFCTSRQARNSQKTY